MDARQIPVLDLRIRFPEVGEPGALEAVERFVTIAGMACWVTRGEWKVKRVSVRPLILKRVYGRRRQGCLEDKELGRQCKMQKRRSNVSESCKREIASGSWGQGETA